MSVTVSFVDPVTPARLEEIKAIIQAIRTAGSDPWSVRIASNGEGFTVTLEGPQYYRRVYNLYGEQSYDPVYLAALVRTEINSFPSTPPQDFAFALAELARLGVPYDDAEIFSGRVLVDGEVFSIQALANLYNNEKLAERFTARSRVTGETNLEPETRMSPRMRIRITGDVSSSEGQELFAQIQTYQDELYYHCACPDGYSCEVVLIETGRQLYDVIVSRQGSAAITPEHWFPVPVRTGTRYIRSFRKPPAVEIASAVGQLIALPLVRIS